MTNTAEMIYWRVDLTPLTFNLLVLGLIHWHFYCRDNIFSHLKSLHIIKWFTGTRWYRILLLHQREYSPIKCNTYLSNQKPKLFIIFRWTANEILHKLVYIFWSIVSKLFHPNLDLYFNVFISVFYMLLWMYHFIPWMVSWNL